ncbi:hypothetical protein CKF54_01185 [Psittacicella hinzii]|uniref:Glycosyl transferase family 25 domain-containing protein n=1 Tax=Psittacicella hinzii TaxID=2028575 RepID=A0A3A1Y7M5_9GAMM|nr:glycosyltransferase family 25 protein [Psittacicella hinzii]RIY34232.1 hypothetical protein CKF54_01185 [Psittacicella hinzii]
MSKLPLFDSIPKFALVMPTGSKTQESFFAQPFSQLFTKVSGFDMTNYLLEHGLISEEVAKEYPVETTFDLIDNFLYSPECMHVPFMEALAPYFDIRAVKDKYDRQVPRRFLGMSDINATVSLINLLAHIALDEKIADDQWILICQDHVILNPEWPQRIEALLTNLLPYNRNLASQVSPEQVKRQRSKMSEKEIEYISKLKFISLSAQGNKTFAPLTKEQQEELKVYPHHTLEQSVSKYTDGIVSPFGEQELGISNVINYHRNGFFLINKFAVLATVKKWAKKRILEMNYGKVRNLEIGEFTLKAMYDKRLDIPEVFDLELKDEFMQRDKYSALELEGADAAGKDYTKLIPLNKSLDFFSDSLWFIFNFTHNSMGYANPFLGINSFLQTKHDLNDADYAHLAAEQSSAVVYNSRLNRFAAQGYDLLQPLPKYVIQGKSHLNNFPGFFAQANTYDFKPVYSPKLEEWSLTQVEKAYFKKIKLTGTSVKNSPSLTSVEASLTQRRLISSLIADKTIDDEQWIVLAKDASLLRPDWYAKLNHYLRWVNIRHPFAKIIVAGYEDKQAGFNFITDQDKDKRFKLLNNAGIYTANEDWISSLGNQFEGIIATSYHYHNFPLILVKKKIFTERKTAEFFKQADGFFHDRFADLIAFEATNVLFINPGLAVLRDTEKAVSEQVKVADPKELEALIDTSDLTAHHANLPWQSQELYRQAVTAADATIQSEVYESDNLPIDPLENVNTIGEIGDYSLEPVSSPLFFGKEKPLFAPLSKEQSEHDKLEEQGNQGEQEDQSKLFSSRFGVLGQEDLVAKVKKYVINLPSSVDRLEAFKKLNNVEDFIVQEAVLGKELSEADIAEQFDVELFNKRYRRTLHAGEYGCALSHTQILRKALYDQEIGLDDWVLIAEDDTRFNPDWYRLLNQVLHYVESNLNQRVEIINGAQNQIPHFDYVNPRKFVRFHSIHSELNNYHQVAPELGLALINRDFPAGAGFYLVRKSLLVRNRARICGKIDWVADDLAQIYTFRPEIFAYTNPQLGFDDRDLESLLDAERVQSINNEKIKLRSIPLDNPSPYVQPGRLHVIQKTLSLEEINKKFPGFQVVKKVDYASLPRSEQEQLFDFDKFKERYDREITADELNLTLAHHQAWCNIRDLPMSDFTFHFVVEDDQTLAPNFLHQVNCICDYVDTRLDLDTLLIVTHNDRQPQDFNKLDPAEYGQHAILAQPEHIYHINSQQDICLAGSKNPNGSGSYVMLKFVPSNMHNFLANGKRYFLAHDFVLGMPFTLKSLAFAQPQISIKP